MNKMLTVVSGPVKVGVGVSTITPPIGVGLAGYGPYLGRDSEGIHDNLFSKGLVMEGKNQQRIAIITNDLSRLSKELVEETKSLVRKRAGVEEDNILITCSHTHMGPATGIKGPWGEPNQEYLEKLPGKISKSVEEACRKPESARAGFGRGELTMVSRNRPDETGPIDPVVGVLKIDGMRELPLAVLFNFACHPITIDYRTPLGRLISRDWPGYSSDMIQSELGTKSLYLQGTMGDINPELAWYSPHDWKPCHYFQGALLTGHIVGSKVIEIAKEIDTTIIEEISLRKKLIELPVKVPSEEEVEFIAKTEKEKHKTDPRWITLYDDWERNTKEKLRRNPSSKVQSEIALLNIKTKDQEGLLIFLGGQPFVKLGLAIRKDSSFENTFLVGMYDQYTGYIPDDSDFQKRSYASTLVPIISNSFPYERSVGKVLVKEVGDFLREVEKDI